MSRKGVHRESSTKMRFKICPVTGGIPTTMTYRSFAARCTSHRTGDVNKHTVMGASHGLTEHDMRRMMCSDCKRGERIAAGKKYTPPKELTILTKSEFTKLASLHDPSNGSLPSFSAIQTRQPYCEGRLPNEHRN